MANNSSSYVNLLQSQLPVDLDAAEPLWFGSEGPDEAYVMSGSEVPEASGVKAEVGHGCTEGWASHGCIRSSGSHGCFEVVHGFISCSLCSISSSRLAFSFVSAYLSFLCIKRSSLCSDML
ncbi:hypothetical protein Rs2_06931 [Raphanus sativus]|nr:hypothetical protein Rs2_06931 [Raphanus sativus]